MTASDRIRFDSGKCVRLPAGLGLGVGRSRLIILGPVAVAEARAKRSYSRIVPTRVRLMYKQRVGRV